MKIRTKPKAEEAAPAQGAVTPDESKPNVYISERFQNPDDPASAAKPVQENFVWAAVLAIIAMVAFIAIIVLQYLDWDKLSIA